MWLVGTATVTTQGLTARYDTTNEEWGLLSGQNWGPRLGHQWGLFHGHGHGQRGRREGCTGRRSRSWLRVVTCPRGVRAPGVPSTVTRLWRLGLLAVRLRIGGTVSGWRDGRGAGRGSRR